MNSQKNNSESHFLILSALFTSGFAIGGLILGWLASSLVIMFDGIYSLMGLLLTLLSLTVSHYIHHPKKSVSPLNKVILEQLMIAIKAVVILLVVVYSLYEAIIAVIHGGRTVDTSVATLFGLINVIGCFYAWRTLANKNPPSSFGLIDAEIKQWKMDTYLSVSVTLGFIIAFGMRFTPWEAYSVYADPCMMLAMSFYFIKVPLAMLTDAVRNLTNNIKPQIQNRQLQHKRLLSEHLHNGI